MRCRLTMPCDGPRRQLKRDKMFAVRHGRMTNFTAPWLLSVDARRPSNTAALSGESLRAHGSLYGINPKMRHQRRVAYRRGGAKTQASHACLLVKFDRATLARTVADRHPTPSAS
jgi:hypothetical protein